MKYTNFFTAACLLCLMLTVPMAYGETIFELIADSSTASPDGIGGETFRFLSTPQIDNGQIVFFGQDDNTTGFFLSENGNLSRVVDSKTIVPGTANTQFGSFLGVPRASISNGQIAFIGGTPPSRGTYVASEGQIDPIVQRLDPVPGRNGQIFIGLDNQYIDDGSIVTRGSFGTGSGPGIYTSDGNSLSKAIDFQDQRPIPNFPGQTFSNFTINDLEDETILFTGGSSNSTEGIYRSTFSGSISAVVDTNTSIPDGVGAFNSFDRRFPQLSNGKVAFVGNGNNDQSGIYLAENGQLTTIADLNTLHPNAVGSFTDLRTPTISGDSVFFFGSGGFGTGIFEFKNDSLTEIISDDDLLNGSSIEQFLSDALSVEGNTLVFAANLSGRQPAIIKATLNNVPEPSSLALITSLLAIANCRSGVMAKSDDL